MAAEGLFVTKSYIWKTQRIPSSFRTRLIASVFDVRFNEDPLRVADQLGRPMAILRLGSKQPRMDRQTGRFMFRRLRRDDYPTTDAGST